MATKGKRQRKGVVEERGSRGPGWLLFVAGVGLAGGVGFLSGQFVPREVPDEFGVGEVTHAFERRAIRLGASAPQPTAAAAPPTEPVEMPAAAGTVAEPVALPGDVVADEGVEEAARAIARAPAPEPEPVRAPDPVPVPEPARPVEVPGVVAATSPNVARAEVDSLRAVSRAPAPAESPPAAPEPVREVAAAAPTAEAARPVARDASPRGTEGAEVLRVQEVPVRAAQAADLRPPERPRPTAARAREHEVSRLTTWDDAERAREALAEVGLRASVVGRGGEWAVVLTSYRDDADRDRQAVVAQRVIRSLR